MPFPKCCSFFARLACVMCLTIAVMTSSLPDAQAHRVYIFAWPENGQLCTESYYTKKTKIQDATVQMHNEQGLVLAQGKSDTTGSLCFAPPETPQNIIFVLDAGQGHKSDFFLPAAQVEEALRSPQSLPHNATAHDVSAAIAASSPPPAVQGQTAERTITLPESTGTDHLRSIIREELQHQLAPLQKELARQQDTGPGMKEIVAGLGWIIALTALAFLYKQKKGL